MVDTVRSVLPNLRCSINEPRRLQALYQRCPPTKAGSGDSPCSKELEAAVSKLHPAVSSGCGPRRCAPRGTAPPKRAPMDGRAIEGGRIMTAKARIAHLAGPNATIQNTPPLVTSNKARVKHRLPLLTNPDGTPARFDVLRPQRLAAPVTVYVEQFSAHPLEADAAELYGPADGYLDSAGQVHKEQHSASDKAVYEVELCPEDGLYPLPYMATQVDGAAWDEECAFLNAPEAEARQGFFPDGSRSFEEIDRLQIGDDGTGNLISAKADIDFYRVLPPSGYTKGLSADRRTDIGAGDIPPERRGGDFFPYKPVHLT